ncbi:unnamed protein product, partial [Symbiodinium sp. CCMP2456]
DVANYVKEISKEIWRLDSFFEHNLKMVFELYGGKRCRRAVLEIQDRLRRRPDLCGELVLIHLIDQIDDDATLDWAHARARYGPDHLWTED